MNLSELIKDIETKYPIGEIKANGTSIWPFLKIFFFDQLYVQGGTRVSLGRKEKISLIKSLSFGLRHSYSGNEYLLFSNSHQRKYINNEYLDKLLSPIGSHLSKALFIEMPVYSHLGKGSGERVKTSLWLRIREEWYKRRMGSSLRWQGKEVLEELLAKYKVALDINDIALRFFAQKRVANRLIQVNPKLKGVFMVTPYMQMGYVHAFREAGIEVVELQHGVINASHFAYNTFVEFDRNFYPNQLWAWGEGVADIFTNGNAQFSQDQIKPIGHFYLDQMANSGNKLSYKESDGAIAVSLQDDATGSKLIPWLIEAANLYPRIRFLLVPRKTPVDDYLADYSFPDNISFSQDDVYITIRKADAHMTVFSSCAIEAPALGRPNVLVNIDGKSIEYYGNRLKGANTQYISKPMELEKALELALNIAENSLKDSIKHEITPNYRTRLESLITTLV